MAGLGCSLRLWYTSVGPLGRELDHQGLDLPAEKANEHLHVERSQALSHQTEYGAAHLSILRSSQREEFAISGSHSTLIIRLPRHSYNYNSFKIPNKYLPFGFAAFEIAFDFWLEVDGHDAVLGLVDSVVDQILYKRAGATVQSGWFGSLELAPGR